MPYTCFGYTSGILANPPIGNADLFMIIGFMSFVVGVIVSMVYRRKSFLHHAIGRFMTVFGIGAVLAVTVAPQARIGWYSYSDPQDATNRAATNISDKIESAINKGWSIPLELDSLKARLELSSADFEDGWRRQMQVRGETQYGKTEYKVVSAGPDGKFGTDDDLIYSCDSNNIVIR